MPRESIIKLQREHQLIILWTLPLLAVVVSRLLNANYFWGLIFFWGVPSLLLTFWAKNKVLKTAVFSGVAMILLTAIDIVFYANHQWQLVSGFKSRFLGLVAWEDFPLWFLWVYFPVIYWEHFFEKESRERVWSSRMSRLGAATVFAFLAIVTVWMWMPKMVLIPYFYLVATAIFVVIPLSLELWNHPRLKGKFLRIGIYFAYVGILYELTALSLGHWFYPSSQFIGWVEVFGLRFPIEELFAWILLGAGAILSWYEYFDDHVR